MQLGSPIPMRPDYEGWKMIYTLKIDFFGKVFKTHWDHDSQTTVYQLMGEINGLNKDGNLVFTDGEPDPDGHVQFGILEIVCGLNFKLADFHMHSGNDARITVHDPGACNDEIKNKFREQIRKNIRANFKDEHSREHKLLPK